jgi:LAO/AO transport system kinase
VTRPVDVAALLAEAYDRSPRAVARLLSLVEDQAPQLPEVMAALAPRAGRAHIVGLTGAPGVGKSTVTSALVSAYRARQLRVAVLAVDPSSPFSGGALLGDRIRMQVHALDSDVFVRSMSSRGHLGGLSSAAPQAIRVLDAVGYDVVIVETVGVGQSEVEVVDLADTTVVLLAPGMGDGVQAAKAGVLEVGDLFVVNKADRDGARVTERDLRGMLRMGSGARSGPPDDPWAPPVIRTVATEGTGIDALLTGLGEHHEWLARTGVLAVRKRARAEREMRAIALGLLRSRLYEGTGAQRAHELAEQVVAGSLDPFAAAEMLIASTGGESR